MIYIKTKMTEMPKSCAFCEGKALDHYCVVTGRITTDYEFYTENRPAWCPLIEIRESENG